MELVKGFETLVIANTAEAFAKPISLIDNPIQRKNRIRIENTLSQRSIFWGGDNKVIVTPFPIPQKLFEANKKILNLSNVTNISPKYNSDSLCQNIKEDNECLRNLGQLLGHNRNINIIAYANTPYLIQLARKLTELGIDVALPETPQGNTFPNGYLDSKAGFRETVGSLPGVLIPEGYICLTSDELLERSNDFRKRSIPFVIKANEGESGWGLLFIKNPVSLNKIALSQKIRGAFKEDGIWVSRPYVAEEYIILNKAQGGGSPSTELYITDDSVDINYSCAQLFDEEGQFNGIAMGQGVLDNDLNHRLEEISMRIGKKYREIGYRGYFDIDFAVSQDNTVFALETNTRRTGGTHVYDFAKRVFNDSWKDFIFFSNDSFKYSTQNCPLSEILEKLRQILFPIDGKREGLVLTLIDEKEPVFGYILSGDSETRLRYFQSVLLDTFRIA